ncbi:MAG: hypothetical protein NC925_04810 [Candidatus Omnitrophica bacterium]|nr:hypothetical protein [Candidatus Omnitrophota bacterium]
MYQEVYLLPIFTLRSLLPFNRFYSIDDALGWYKGSLHYKEFTCNYINITKPITYFAEVVVNYNKGKLYIRGIDYLPNKDLEKILELYWEAIFLLDIEFIEKFKEFKNELFYEAMKKNIQYLDFIKNIDKLNEAINEKDFLKIQELFAEELNITIKEDMFEKSFAIKGFSPFRDFTLKTDDKYFRLWRTYWKYRDEDMNFGNYVRGFIIPFCTIIKAKKVKSDFVYIGFKDNKLHIEAGFDIDKEFYLKCAFKIDLRYVEKIFKIHKDENIRKEILGERIKV